MRTRARLVLAGLAALGLARGANAQPQRGGAPDERAGDAAVSPVRPPRATERRAQIKKKIRAMRAYTLTEELALDDQTAGRLFPVLARYDDETDRLLEKRVDVQRRLRHADTIRDGRTIERAIDDAIANQRGFWELEDRRITELRKILTPVQAAKLLVVLPALERRIQNQLRKAIIQRGDAQDTGDDDLQPDEAGPRVRPKQPLRRREAPLAPDRGPSNAPGNVAPCSPNTEPCR